MNDWSLKKCITILALGIKCGYYSIKMFENTRTKDRILNTILNLKRKYNCELSELKACREQLPFFQNVFLVAGDGILSYCNLLFINNQA